VFPVSSSNVLVEACQVRRENDAPIYVGQSADIVVRFNDVREGVAAIEIENSAGALVHNNFMTDNTGGILVFKDPNLPVQDSQDHTVISNAIIDNNTPNFGTGFVANVPQGTGMMIISTDDSLFQGNIVRENGTFGVLMLDQIAVNILVPGTFPVLSADQTCRNNQVRRNAFVNNSLQPDPNVPVAGQKVFALGDDGGGNHDNCFSPNGPSGGALVVPLFQSEDCTPGP
jgi:parallel beta-helix repeat protein